MKEKRKAGVAKDCKDYSILPLAVDIRSVLCHTRKYRKSAGFIALHVTVAESE